MLIRRLLFILVMLPVSVMAQMVMPIYEGEVPESKKCNTKELIVHENNRDNISKVVDPTITAYLPTNQQQPTAAVIICPGGGYGRLAMTHEGYDVANRFKEAGIAAFILKYRLPNDSCMTDKSTGPLQDAQQAIYLVRKNASAWNIDPNKIGIMGFSAGGHLASTAGTHFTKAILPNKESISVRPDFQLLIYPVISLTDSLAHMGSRINLIGKDASSTMIKQYSNEMQVTAKTPPAFLVHASDDKAVPANNSLVYAQALMKYNIPVEVHIYPHGGHGFGMVNKTTKADWFLSALDWMRASGWMQ
jgi:acetyl esterase/lipase